LEHRAIFIHDQRNAIKKAERLGLEQGIKQGIEQGIEQGALREKLAIARQLLNLFDDNEIARITGLSLAKIERLR
jgi:predicted transposase/invertase (TIGR01784 family)